MRVHVTLGSAARLALIFGLWALWIAHGAYRPELLWVTIFSLIVWAAGR